MHGGVRSSRGGREVPKSRRVCPFVPEGSGENNILAGKSRRGWNGLLRRWHNLLFWRALKIEQPSGMISVWSSPAEGAGQATEGLSKCKRTLDLRMFLWEAFFTDRAREQRGTHFFSAAGSSIPHLFGL